MNFPYIEQFHYPLQRLLKSYDINLVDNNKHNRYTITGSVMEKLPLSLRSNIVYRIPCKDCHSTYIGQTKRYLKNRIQEHMTSLKHVDSDHTALTHHVKSINHNFNF